MIHKFQISEVTFSQAQKELRSIRQEVFIVEQKVDRQLEFDGEDSHCRHFLVQVKEKAVATARLNKKGPSLAKIERMAVLRPFRKQGLGSKLLDYILKTCEENKFQSVYLHAQETAMPFYKKKGFKIEGKAFIEANIRHYVMKKSLLD